MNSNFEPSSSARAPGWLRRALIPLCLGFSAAGARAQWISTNYQLKGGWNAIYLHGEATHATPDALFASEPEVLEVWRWNPNPNPTQFSATPLLPTNGTPDWSKWVRGGPSPSLARLTGQAAYLVKCDGAATATHTVNIVQRPLPPSAAWVRNGANLLGFPTVDTGNFPTFSSYFATFPAAIAANTKIFKYVGGDLSAANPLQIFSPNAEPLDRNKAYWFSSEVVGNFYGPLQITLSSSDGLGFGRQGSVITARVVNRTASVMTLTIQPVSSNSAPAGQESITGPVPLTRRTLDADANPVETPIASAYTEVIAPQSSMDLSFGIDRGAMTSGAPGALFASMLRFTDAAHLTDILLPATARQSSLSGLWIGDAQVTAVESKPQADDVTPAARPFPLRYLLHVADDGKARVLSQVFMGQLAAAPNDFGLCTKQTGLKTETLASARRLVATHMPLDRVLDGTGGTGSGSVSIPGVLKRTISLPFNDPTNPFVHQYHPDHDNKDARGEPLVAGQESYSVTRQVTFTFTSTPPAGSLVTTGWGSSVIGGTYAETIQGLNKDSTGVGTGNGLKLTGTFELRRASELGSISINP
ncbi:MAG: hypothetical protein EOP86_05845 [Verrucomicrobiaceae bacterium]|nr:MAG: hypothetical protein EOP86_05845 [Verrucomicrobiaceae bacterium]